MRLLTKRRILLVGSLLIAAGFCALQLRRSPSIQSQVTLRWTSSTNSSYCLKLHNGLDRQTLYYESRRVQIKSGDEWQRYYYPEEVLRIADSFPVPIKAGETVDVWIESAPKYNGPWRVEVELMVAPSPPRFYFGQTLDQLREKLGVQRKLRTIRVWSDATNSNSGHE